MQVSAYQSLYFTFLAMSVVGFLPAKIGRGWRGVSVLKEEVRRGKAYFRLDLALFRPLFMFHFSSSIFLNVLFWSKVFYFGTDNPYLDRF